MRPTVNTANESPRPEDLPLPESPNEERLESIKAHLDLILTALESLANINSEAIVEAARELGVEETIADRMALWRLRQSNPQRKSSGGRKKLDVEEARALVLVTGYLARRYQEPIRRAVVLLEQVTAENQEPHRIGLLGDYLDRFSNTYLDRMEDGDTIPSAKLTRLAFKLLIDLLFYSAPNGHRRLWLALIG
ncbi:DUF3038 domain-containing protein [Pannus brasiliensis CCIBt3594]|uniref:DUF3038 domain-containing protein n=1 Tax=Pannus brasiliensis CCIBt3594 TaxID=1427578 RepID=A0AAW9QKJ3_9CHRO